VKNLLTGGGIFEAIFVSLRVATISGHQTGGFAAWQTTKTDGLPHGQTKACHTRKGTD